MGSTALGLVLVAAVAHAAWNFLAKQADRSGAAFVWLYGLVAIALYGPPALLVLALDPGAVSAAGVAFMVGSGVLHAGYFLGLQRGYKTGDLSVVYPLARGTGPLLSVLAAVVVLGERPTAPALAGAALIVVAVLSLASGVRRLGHVQPGSGIGFALMTGALIAAYTLWDAHAVGALDQPPLPYYLGTETARALLLAPLALRDRTGIATAWRASRRAVIGIGALSPLAYVLVLEAFTLAPVSYVAPAREVSVVLGALLGVWVLGEGDARRRLLAAAAIAAGILALALG